MPKAKEKRQHPYVQNVQVTGKLAGDIAALWYPGNLHRVSLKEVETLFELWTLHKQQTCMMRYNHSKGGTPYKVWLPGHAKVSRDAAKILVRLRKGLK